MEECQENTVNQPKQSAPEQAEAPQQEEALDSEDFSSFTDDELVSESENLFENGKKYMNDSKFDEASKSFQTALKMRVIRFGQLGSETAKYYLWYGKSLLNVNRKETGVFGDAEKKQVQQQTPTPADKEKPKTEAKPQSEVKPETEQKSAEKSKHSEQKTAQELADDRQLAWENIEIARVILSKSDLLEHQFELARCHGYCGEVFLENDLFEQATAEFLRAAEMHEKLEGCTSRKAAGDWVSAAVGSVYAGKSEPAYEMYLKGLTHIDNRMRQLMGEELNAELENDEDELILLEKEDVEKWLEENKENSNFEEVKELLEMAAEVSLRLDGMQEEFEAQQQNPLNANADITEIVKEMILQQLGGLKGLEGQGNAELADKEEINDLGVARSNKDNELEDKNEEPIHDLGVAKSKTQSEQGTKRSLKNAKETSAKKQKTE